MLSISSNPASTVTQLKANSFVGDSLPKPAGALSFKAGKRNNKMAQKVLESFDRACKEASYKRRDPLEVKEIRIRELNQKVIEIWNEIKDEARKIINKPLKK